MRARPNLFAGVVGVGGELVLCGNLPQARANIFSGTWHGRSGELPKKGAAPPLWRRGEDMRPAAHVEWGAPLGADGWVAGG